MFVKTNSNQALFYDVVDNVTVDHLSIIVESPPWQFDWSIYLLTDFCEEIISPQRSDTRPNFPTKNVVGGAKFVWHPGYQKPSRLPPNTSANTCNIPTELNYKIKSFCFILRTDYFSSRWVIQKLWTFKDLYMISCTLWWRRLKTHSLSKYSTHFKTQTFFPFI